MYNIINSTLIASYFNLAQLRKFRGHGFGAINYCYMHKKYRFYTKVILGQTKGSGLTVVKGGSALLDFC